MDNLTDMEEGALVEDSSGDEAGFITEVRLSDAVITSCMSPDRAKQLLFFIYRWYLLVPARVTFYSAAVIVLVAYPYGVAPLLPAPVLPTLSSVGFLLPLFHLAYANKILLREVLQSGAFWFQTVYLLMFFILYCDMNRWGFVEVYASITAFTSLCIMAFAHDAMVEIRRTLRKNGVILTHVTVVVLFTHFALATYFSDTSGFEFRTIELGRIGSREVSFTTLSLVFTAITNMVVFSLYMIWSSYLYSDYYVSVHLRVVALPLYDLETDID